MEPSVLRLAVICDVNAENQNHLWLCNNSMNTTCRVCKGYFPAVKCRLWELKPLFHKNNFNSRSNNKNWTNLISVWFYQLYVSADRLHTGTKTCTQTAEGKILFLVIKMFGWSDCVLVACQDKKKAGLSCYLSHLKYLKAVDVQDAHDLVPSFSLCLQGHNIGTIRNKVQQWSFVSLNK